MRGDQDARAIANMLRSCTNLREIELTGCYITDEQLILMVEAMRGHRMLEKLLLCGNCIGLTGCQAIAT